MYQELDVERHRGAGPALWDSVTELPRVLFEMWALAYTWPALGLPMAARRGDGHPVLVLPGFTAGDESTVILRHFLSRLGYRSLPWGLGQNTGSPDLQERLFKSFEHLQAQYPETLSIVGQSLGGVYARELARRFPERVRQTIMLGSPFSSQAPESTSPMVSRLFQYLSGMSRDQMRDEIRRHPPEPPPVPSCAIYSKHDGVVHWSSCLEFPGPQAENIEVPGSHSGMALNPAVLHVIADRLAQPEGGWKPFQRNRGCRSWIYPEPEQKELRCAS